MNKKYETIDLKYEKYKVCIGTPIIATQNIKEKQIFNKWILLLRILNILTLR